MLSQRANPQVIIIGAGPAGLTAAYELANHGVPSLVLEEGGVVGGLSRTARYKGYRFDIGGHRFYTKVGAVNKMWRNVLGDDLLRRPRLSRIHYQGRYFRYPLELTNVLHQIGPIESAFCLGSYLKASIAPRPLENTLEDWLINRFGYRLFERFFKTYTEKVWGMPCSALRAEWAAQRIRGVSIPALVKHSAHRVFLGDRPDKSTPKSLIHEFDYPRHGPGMMWDRTRHLAEQGGAQVRLKSPVEKIYWSPGGVKAVRAAGQTIRGEYFISSMPIRDLVAALDPAPPPEIVHLASKLQYRDFLTVALILKGNNPFPDNWLYIHDPTVRVGRIQNYKNWSPDMVPENDSVCLGMEYFCSQTDDLWRRTNRDLIRLAKQELSQLGIVDAARVVDGTVERAPKAYPVYDEFYRGTLDVIREFLRILPNLQLVGRNGMHRYNNQDHSMLTAMLATRNILGANYDLWKLSSSLDYGEELSLDHEELAAFERSQPWVPTMVNA